MLHNSSSDAEVAMRLFTFHTSSSSCEWHDIGWWHACCIHTGRMAAGKWAWLLRSTTCVSPYRGYLLSSYKHPQITSSIPATVLALVLAAEYSLEMCLSWLRLHSVIPSDTFLFNTCTTFQRCYWALSRQNIGQEVGGHDGENYVEYDPVHIEILNNIVKCKHGCPLEQTN